MDIRQFFSGPTGWQERYYITRMFYSCVVLFGKILLRVIKTVCLTHAAIADICVTTSVTRLGNLLHFG